MEFDEYDYLEKTVENPETTNGGIDQMDKCGEGRKKRVKKHKSENVKRSRTRSVGDYESNEGEKERSSSSRHRSRERYRRRRSSRGYKIKDEGTTDRRREPVGLEDERRSSSSSRDNQNPTTHSERYSGDCDGGRERSRYTNRDCRFHPDTDYGATDTRSELPTRDSHTRRSKEKTEEVLEPEVDPERDQRTVFAYQISLKADERDVYEFFSRAGKVRDVRLVIDRTSRRSKGVGYVEFYDVMSVPMAIALSGQPLLGQQVMVKPSEAEKNLVRSIASVAAGDIGTVGPCSGEAGRLYVGNLHVNIKEDQLRQVFEPFGSVELVQLPSDLETGHGKGYGFVQFSRLEDARAALSLDGQLDIAGQIMKVSAVTDQTGWQEVGGNAGDFDDDEDGGLSLNAQSRTLLMQKLDHTRTTSSGPGPVSSQVVDNPGLPAAAAAPVIGAASGVSSFVVPFGQIPVPSISGFPAAGLSLPAVSVPSIDTVGFPSECLLLKNMFDPKLESEPEFDQDIKEDVEDECSKFGKLKHIFVDKKSSGFVYLRFENSQSAIAAQRALHGRWFAGKMITATFMVPKDYEVKFHQSK